jgi:hypothetical protein
LLEIIEEQREAQVRCGTAAPLRGEHRVQSGVEFNQDADPELRGVAYLSARLASGLLTSRDQAQLPEDIHQLDVDWSWIRSIREQD